LVNIYRGRRVLGRTGAQGGNKYLAGKQNIWKNQESYQEKKGGSCDTRGVVAVGKKTESYCVNRVEPKGFQKKRGDWGKGNPT